MLSILPFIQLLSNVILVALQAAGVTSPSITALINSLEGTIIPLITNLSTGTSSTSDTLAVLGALSGVLATLQKQTGIAPELLSQINALDQAVEAAIVAFLQAQKGIDLTVLTPIAPIA